MSVLQLHWGVLGKGKLGDGSVKRHLVKNLPTPCETAQPKQASIYRSNSGRPTQTETHLFTWGECVEALGLAGDSGV